MTLHVCFRQRQDVLKYCMTPMSGKSRFLCRIRRRKRLKRYAPIMLKSDSRSVGVSLDSTSEKAKTLRPHNFQWKSLRGAYLWNSASEKAKTLRPHNFQSEVTQGGVSLVFGVGKG